MGENIIRCIKIVHKMSALLKKAGSLSTRKTSIECCHPAFSRSLRAWCQYRANHNITHFIWIQVSLIQQCLKEKKMLLTLSPLCSYHAMKHKLVMNTDLQHSSKQLLRVCILKTPSFGLGDCSSVCTITIG